MVPHRGPRLANVERPRTDSEALLRTRRYQQADEPFKLFTEVDLGDGEPPVRVDVDFMKPRETKIKKNVPKLLPGFRPLDADGCAAAFRQPEVVEISGHMTTGARNTVRIRVASIPDFILMKSYALLRRDKPKDAYDICYSIENYPGGMQELSLVWKMRRQEKQVTEVVAILREKFSSVDAFGPRQVVEFYNSSSLEERAMQARRAFELVQRFLTLFED